MTELRRPNSHHFSQKRYSGISPQLSVIIPVWNGEDTIGGTLDALRRQTAEPSQFEILVVDNGSADRTREIVQRYSEVQLLSEPDPGSYRARNRAVAAAKGAHFLFTDADCLPDPDWVEAALARIARHPEDCLIGGRVTLFREEGAGTIASLYEEMTGFNQDWNINEGGYCVTANWLCSRSALARVGGFDDGLLSGGDVKCSRQMGAAGMPLIYADEMVVRHPTRASIRELARKRRRVVGGRWQEMDRKARLRTMSGTLASENFDHLRWAKGGKHSLPQKAGIMGVVAAMYAASQYEALRLKLGFAPYRS